MKRLMILTLALLITGCNGGSSGSGGVAGSSLVSGAFSDASVTNFSQTSGIAKLNKSVPSQMIELVIPSAHAGGGNISCISGEAISFQMDALGNTVNVNTTCAAITTVDLAIRVGLLESMDNSAIQRKISDAGASAQTLDFTNGGANG